MAEGMSERVAHLHLEEALQRLAESGARFTTLFEHGTLEVEIYAPQSVDPQQPHRRDEVYVVARGSGTYFNGIDRKPFQPGDLLFAPANTPHRFEDFTDDFAVWVLFYGPDGGEVAESAE
jgi:mannose-6-phosphate isomerase-like protein (cupin superfamily)